MREVLALVGRLTETTTATNCWLEQPGRQASARVCVREDLPFSTTLRLGTKHALDVMGARGPNYPER
jgi:hypothetical protein